MKILINFIILLLITTSCTLNKVVKKHGVRNLEKKQSELTINQSNTNDIRSILGPPSTKSKFDNDVWIYIERKQTQSKLKNLFLVIIFFVLVNNCGFKKRVDYHGVHLLKKKSEILFNFSNFDNLSQKCISDTIE